MRRWLISAVVFLGSVFAGFGQAATPSGVDGSRQEPHCLIYLLAGQSNMDGRGNVKDLTGPLAKYAQPLPAVSICFAAGGLHRPYRENQGLEPLQPGCSGTPAKAGGKPPANTFGPELGFGHAMAEALPGRKILLIKVSEGGTNLSSDWNPDATGKLYAQFIKFVQATQQKITEAGGTSEIRGLLWMQGESDAGSSTEQYQTRLAGLIARTRADLKIKELPFLIGQVYDNGKRNTVIAAQKAVAKAIPATAFVEADGLQTFDKGTHFDAASQIELGKRFAREMLRLNPQK